MPSVGIVRGAKHNPNVPYPYQATYFHVTPSSMVRAFLAMMTLEARRKAGAEQPAPMIWPKNRRINLPILHHGSEDDDLRSDPL